MEWIQQFGEIPFCNTCTPTDSNVLFKPNLGWIEKQDNPLRKTLIELYENRNQGRNYYINQKGVGNPIFTNEAAYSNMQYPDSGFRLLSLYRYWNMIHYFFLYRHLMDEDWDTKLKEYILKFVKAKNELQYELTALELIGDIKDTHANLWEGNDEIQRQRGNYYPPFHVQFIENQLVVVDFYNYNLREKIIVPMRNTIAIGDIITKINNQSVQKIVDSLSAFYPAFNEAARLRDMAVDLLRSTDDTISIQYLSYDITRQKQLKLYPHSTVNPYR